MPRQHRWIKKTHRTKVCRRCDKIYNTPCKFGRYCEDCKLKHWRHRKDG